MRGALTSIAAGLLALVPSSDAHARWSKATTIPGVRIAAGPILASNHQGDVLMAWNDVRGFTRVAFASKGGPFGRPRRIPGPSVETYPGEMTAALGADRTAVVAWDDCRGELDDPTDSPCRSEVWAAARVPGHRWAHGKLVSDPDVDAFSPMVAAGGRGATVTYSDGEIVFGARSGPRGGFRRPRLIAGGNSPAVSRSGRGTERFVWIADAGIKERRRFPSRRMTRVRFVSRSFVHGYPVFGFGAAGSVAAIWDNEFPYTVTAGVARSGHRMRERTLDRIRGGLFAYSLAGAPGDDFVASFVRDTASARARHRLRASRSSGRKPFSPARYVRGARTESAPNVAVTRGGHALVTWLDVSGRWVGVAASSPGEDFTRRGTFRLAHKTDPSCEVASDLCDLPVVALDGRGHGYMAWPDGLGLRVARYRVPHRVSIAPHP